jgi:hypothetical protein
VNRRLISTSFAALAGVGLLGSLAACSSVATVETGTCLNTSDLQGQIEEFNELDCTEEHDAQVVGKFELEDGDFPGDETITAEAEEQCAATFEEYVGISYDESSLSLNFIGPTEQTWDQASDREVICIAFTSDGSTVTESWEGAAV